MLECNTGLENFLAVLVDNTNHDLVCAMANTSESEGDERVRGTSSGEQVSVLLVVKGKEWV